MSEREHKGRGRGSDGAEQSDSAHANPIKAAAMRRRQQERRAGGPTTVEGERGAVGDQQTGAASEQSPAMLDLFNPSKSTDEELGHDEQTVKAQADAMRTALEKHLDDFQLMVTTALGIVYAGMAGLKKSRVKTDPLGLGTIGKVANTALHIAWDMCGGAGEIKEVIGLAKEELLGPAEKYAETAKELIESALEGGGEVTVNDVLARLVAGCKDQAISLVTHAKRTIPRGKESDAALASTWRLITGTEENMTDKDGAKLDGSQKETVTTIMLEQFTGIQVGGAVAMQLANTIGQQAEADFARVVVGADARADAVENALTGGVVGEMASAARATKDSEWIEQDKERRASVKVGS